VKGTPAQFIATPMKAVEQVTKGFDMTGLVRDAADAMQRTITTVTGTKSGPGRYDTGLMFQAVDWRISLPGNKIIGEFGWLDNREAYFLYQEEGFTHYLSGQQIPAMFALQDAGVAAQQEFLKRLSEAVK
jgi:hypothetical protein